ncbi:MAG: YdbH domain-containing protein [Deltaproteobacteria bacterium]|nr:YdbH domain-containing protein [Deltaproteobacteria bacterium]
MTFKRKIYLSIIIVFSLFVAGLAASSFLFLFVPRYVETRVIPSIIKDNGLRISSLKVRSIGLNGAEISDLKIGPDNNGSLGIDSIRLDYSISGILGRRLHMVTLSGISVDLEYSNNQITLKGFEGLNTGSETGPDIDSARTKPFTIDKLSVVNSVCSLKVNEKRLRIPFDLKTAAFNQYRLPEKFLVKLFLYDNELIVEGNILSNSDIKLEATSGSFLLNSIEDVIDEIITVDLKGVANIELSAILSQAPFSVTDLSAFIKLKRTNINLPGIRIRNIVNSDNSEEPVIIKAGSKDLKHWEYGISQALLDMEPAPVILEFSGTADLYDDRQAGNIKALTRIMAKDDLPAIKWDISVEGGSNNYKAVITGKPDTAEVKADSVKVDFNDMLLTMVSPHLEFNAEYNNGSVSGSYFFNTKKIVYKGFDITMDIPDYQVKGVIQYDRDRNINTSAMVSFENGNMSMSGSPLKIHRISAGIPFSWPFPGKGKKGRLMAGKIVYDNYTLGPAVIEMQQTGGDVPFTGNIKIPALPDMVINLSGETAIEPAFNEMNINVDIPSYTPASGIDLGILLPALKGYNYGGTLKGNGTLTLSDSGMESGLALKIVSGAIKSSENGLRLENIMVDLMLEDLVSMESPFGQRLTIGDITFGDINAKDFTLDFKIEGPSLLFVERGGFKWCGGHINIQSFRINPEKEEYDITLFCDRLKLSEILAQFGVANASGGGTVNGKLPIKIANNRFTFEDGFLYSTPGGGGKISLTETDILTKGLDPGSAAYAQMDIAREALKAFDYTWVKMSFGSEKDELVLKLQFDGKPEGRLPFKYSTDAGKFIRVGNASEGSDFEGISLDVNFRVPLDRILNIKDMMDMMD